MSHTTPGTGEVSSKDARPEAVSDTLAMVASMAPHLHPSTYVYATIPSNHPPDVLSSLLPHAHTIFNESEGISLLLPLSICQGDLIHGHQLEWNPPLLRHIELRVFSSLEGVGLTAAVSAALTEGRIPCNIVAGLYHDHVFIPEMDAERAVELLMRISDKAKKNLKAREDGSQEGGS